MIVIYTPYGRNEVTAAAIRLADVAVEGGLDVRVAATGPHETGVHPFWDSRVVKARGDAFPSAKGASHCVWFVAGGMLLDEAKLAAKNATHTLVPSWHALRLADVPLLNRYDQVICPSRSCHEMFRKHVYGGKTPDNKVLSWCRWDAGLQHTPRYGTVAAGQRRVMVHLDSTGIDECPLIALHTIDELLASHDDVGVTALCTKSWAKKDRARIKALLTVHGHRLTFLPQKDFHEQAQLFQSHDWLVLPSVKSDFGLTAVRGNACGLPVICYDVEPHSEHVVDGRNGALVPCELGGNWMNAPVAAATSVNLVERCKEVLADPQTLSDLQGRDWKLEGNRTAFTSFWHTAFGLW
jgi:glycosyltransferase involved in cell wall biosynthesis